MIIENLMAVFGMTPFIFIQCLQDYKTREMSALLNYLIFGMGIAVSVYCFWAMPLYMFLTFIAVPTGIIFYLAYKQAIGIGDFWLLSGIIGLFGAFSFGFLAYLAMIIVVVKMSNKKEQLKLLDRAGVWVILAYLLALASLTFLAFA